MRTEQREVIKNIEKMMERFANTPRDSMGARQPGELSSYEKSFSREEKKRND